MKKLKYLYIALLFALVVSCEDVINIELNTSPSQIVIESLITDDSLHCVVSLNMSEDFYKTDEYTKISGAKVFITDDLQNKYFLKEFPEGFYSTNEITGKPLTTYNIQIETGNNSYHAKSKMPTKVILDSLESEWAENPHGKGYNVIVNFKDPAGEKNFYRFKILKNGLEYKNESGNEIIVWDDKVFDGKKVSLPVKRGSTFFQIGDTIKIDMYSIDEQVYKYFLTLKNAMAKGDPMSSMGRNMLEGSSAPANPLNNFDNGALGYFAAIAISSKTIVIKNKVSK